mgnify:CR=1 FL=1
MTAQHNMNSFKPNLATKWTVNKTATEVSLDLRKGVVFADGSKFDATVAKKNLDHFVSANGPQAANMAGAKVAVVDADDLVDQDQQALNASVAAPCGMRLHSASAICT